MRVIKSDSGFLAYQKLFRHIQTNSCTIVVWQVMPGSGERRISETKLNSFHLESKLLHMELPSDQTLDVEAALYVYSEDGQFIFKSTIQDVKTNVLSVNLPEEIKLLEDPDVSFIRGNSGVDLSSVWKTKRAQIEEQRKPDYMVVKSMSERTARDQDFLNNEFNPVSVDEEDKLFADKRETPRARPKTEKWVKIKSESSEEVHLFRLFDLSQGGIGFLTIEAHLFPKGSEVRVVGFEEFDLDDPLIAKVMSQRAIDDTQIEFKIGCKFLEGQS